MGGEPGLCVAPSPRAEVACGQPQRPPGGPTWEAAGRRLEHRGRLCGGLRVSWPRAGGQRLSVGATGPPLIAAPSPAHAVSVHLKPVVLGGRCRQAAGHGFTIKGAFSVLPERFCPPTPGQVRLHFTGKGKKPRDAEQLSKSHSSQGRSVRLGASRSDSEGRVPGAPWAPGHRDTQQGPGPFADRAAWEQVTAAGSQVGLVTPDDPGLRETAQNRGGGARLAGQQKGALSRMGRALSL